MFFMIVDFWTRPRVCSDSTSRDVPGCQVLQCEHVGTFLLIPLPLHKVRVHHVVCHGELQGSCLLHNPLLYSMASAQPSKVLKRIQARQSAELESIERNTWLKLWSRPIHDGERLEKQESKEELEFGNDYCSRVYSYLGWLMLLHLSSMGQVRQSLHHSES